MLESPSCREKYPGKIFSSCKRTARSPRFSRHRASWGISTTTEVTIECTVVVDALGSIASCGVTDDFLECLSHLPVVGYDVVQIKAG